MWIMIDKYFPLIKVVTTKNDKPWITPKIKKLIAERQKAHKISCMYNRDFLAKIIKIEIKSAKRKYNESKAKTFSSGSTKEWYQHITHIINNGKRSKIVLNNVPELAQKPIEEIFNILTTTFPPYAKHIPL